MWVQGGREAFVYLPNLPDVPNLPNVTYLPYLTYLPVWVQDGRGAFVFLFDVVHGVSSVGPGRPRGVFLPFQM